MTPWRTLPLAGERTNEEEKQETCHSLESPTNSGATSAGPEE